MNEFMDIKNIESIFNKYTESKTNNEDYDSNGFLVVKNLVDVSKLICDVPKERGMFRYFDSLDKFHHEEMEQQVKGSVSRYYYPPYKEVYFEVKRKLEDIIGKKLYTTYYYDRFYFPGQELEKHKDRDACEISVSVHVGTNLKDPWHFGITDNKGKDNLIVLNPGDGILYKGCENIHWRSPMPGKKRNIIRKFSGKESLYYHQIFFHYVLADGVRSHCAFDAAR